MKNTVIDFESFFDQKNGVSVKTQGVPNYWRDADAYLLSVVSDDIQWCGGLKEAQEKFGESFWQDKDRQLWSANWNFENGGLKKHFVEPTVDGKCVLDLASGNQYPRVLAPLAKVLLGVKLDKDLRDGMDGKRFEDLSPEEQERMRAYCLEDSVRALDIINKLPPLTDIEDQAAAHTRLINRRGVHIDVERVDRDTTLLHKMRHDAYLKVPWRNEVDGFKGLLSPVKLSEWCTSRGFTAPVSRAKTNAESNALIKTNPDWAMIMGAFKDLTATNRLLSRAKILKERLTEDNRLPLDLIYCGAPHTRRWSSQGWNIQALDKNSVSIENTDPDGDPEDEDSEDSETDVWVREWIVPGPGKVFLVYDFSQIEPRCLNWLVGNDEMLSAIRAGYAIYEAFSLFYKGWKGEKGTLKKTNPKLYAAAKAEVLGLGYGLGAKKFMATAAKEGVIYDLPQAKKVVQEFRAHNPKITAFWGQMDGLLRNAVLSKDKHLEITMPTGDKLRHFHVMSTMKEVTLEDGTKVKKPSLMTHKIYGDMRPKISRTYSVWGGVLVENVTQRMARDCMMEAMLRVEKAGFEVKWTVHDELILEIDKGNEAYIKDAMKQCEQLLVQQPPWAEGLPLAVEGVATDRYTK